VQGTVVTGGGRSTNDGGIAARLTTVNRSGRRFHHGIAVADVDAPTLLMHADGRMSTLPGMSTLSDGGSIFAVGPTAVAFESGLIWEFHSVGISPAAPGAYLSALNPNTGLASSSSLPVPGIGGDGGVLVHVTAPGSPGLWVVVGVN
jgi:hypothetical protein